MRTTYDTVAAIKTPQINIIAGKKSKIKSFDLFFCFSFGKGVCEIRVGILGIDMPENSIFCLFSFFNSTFPFPMSIPTGKAHLSHTSSADCSTNIIGQWNNSRSINLEYWHVTRVALPRNMTEELIWFRSGFVESLQKVEPEIKAERRSLLKIMPVIVGDMQEYMIKLSMEFVVPAQYNIGKVCELQFEMLILFNEAFDVEK